MKIQSDSDVRIVALTNLVAMCDRISGICHKFSVVKVSPHRVLVEYSNPDEYGRYDPVIAHYPCFPSGFDSETPLVVLSAVRYSNGEDEAWQAFGDLTDCPQLWRDQDGKAWRTEYEIRLEKHSEFKVSSTWDKDGCIQTWHSKDQNFPSWRMAQDWATAQMHELDFAPRS